MNNIETLPPRKVRIEREIKSKTTVNIKNENTYDGEKSRIARKKENKKKVSFANSLLISFFVLLVSITYYGFTKIATSPTHYHTNENTVYTVNNK